MIPLRDSTPSKSFPIVTVILIALNIYIFAQIAGLDMESIEEVYFLFGLVPNELNQPNLSLDAYLPFLTSMFMHGSWSHVIGNMWILWLFGDNIEDHMGHFKFLAFYLLSGIVADFAHCFIFPLSEVPVVGASGAVAGIMGAYFLMFRHAKILTYIPPFFLFNVPAWFYLGVWIVTQFYSGAIGLIGINSSGIAFWAHIGGFAFGALVHRFFLKQEGYY
jgi:membrane associated rhomboid family serine protease